jgi:hypothetical protein
MEEDITSKLFPADDKDRTISLVQASYLRIFDKNSDFDEHNIKTSKSYAVPKGKEVTVISGKSVKFS